METDCNVPAGILKRVSLNDNDELMVVEVWKKTLQRIREGSTGRCQEKNSRIHSQSSVRTDRSARCWRARLRRSFARNSVFSYFYFLQLRPCVRLARPLVACVLVLDSHLDPRCCCFSAATISTSIMLNSRMSLS